MSWNSKVVWSEGMLLQPQHLQQHDRFLQAHLEARVGALRAYGWGFSRFELDEQHLALGKLALKRFSGVLPDGTPVGLPFDEMPLPLEIPGEARDMTVVLALPTQRHGVAEVDDRPSAENFARHRAVEYEAWDSNGLDSSALMTVGKQRLRLAFENDVADAYTSLGVARVIERRADKRVVLDLEYCPPCLDVNAAPLLVSFLEELLGLLHQRSEAMAMRLSQPGGSGAAEISDFLLLQVLNRSEPLIRHLASMTGLHPEALYQALAPLAGELATFTRPDKRSANYPVYRHAALAESFAPLMVDLRRSLATVIDTRAVQIPLEERQFGIRVAVVPDPQLLRSATFVLAVHAQMPAEAVRSGFPPQVKIGSVEKIRDLVNLQLPGIALRPLPVAPRQLPFHAGFTYFELDRASDYWQQLNNSAGFAMHVAGAFPGLDMQFWAIRN
ncbi:type VI secretion system baseplate subunit TssK [Pseudomonas sp. SZMC_28357]|uniref:type VI secretion system baseplate subunit TssK n=1 Tax=Pseudomonas sp. SZMC_28357 TaxID=3074380 RepID=UPI0028713817|nr:type VI secretion system baseplate subunit TssK [Pseudomonas sp. SZMC_28357]MDR9751377.1 type VI secretion system baseplate subunit TssK [Pseudomonas sp. SZMC_28357]